MNVNKATYDRDLRSKLEFMRAIDRVDREIAELQNKRLKLICNQTKALERIATYERENP